MKLLSRQAYYNTLFGATSLFIMGLLCMPALLFNPSTEWRIVQFLFFWFLCWVFGKKNNPLITITVIFFIVIFNLIAPYGRVLYSIGVLKITQGALEIGIHRAITLAGLVMLSRLSIRGDLKIPGSFGSLVADSLHYFNIIMESKKRITINNFIADIDQLLIDISNKGKTEEISVIPVPAAVVSSQTKPGGFLILLVIVILSWLPWVYNFVLIN